MGGGGGGREREREGEREMSHLRSEISTTSFTQPTIMILTILYQRIILPSGPPVAARLTATRINYSQIVQRSIVALLRPFTDSNLQS